MRDNTGHTCYHCTYLPTTSFLKLARGIRIRELGTTDRVSDGGERFSKEDSTVAIRYVQHGEVLRIVVWCGVE